MRMTTTLITALAALLTTTPAIASSHAEGKDKSDKRARMADKRAAREIRALIANKPAKIGVAWLTDGRLTTINDNARYPMLSVFKLHVAVAALRGMERRGESLDSLTRVTADQLREDTYSPMLWRHGKGDLDISTTELLRYCLAESDNNACDILVERAGGIEKVRRETQSIGIRRCHITETEASMHADRKAVYRNRCSPSSLARLTRDIFESDMLAGQYAEVMRQTLFLTTTGKDKIRAGLEPGMTLAHKTGSSDRSDSGVKAGDNDAGMITLGDGRRLYLAVMIKDSAMSDADNAALTALITKIILRHVGDSAARRDEADADERQQR